MNSLTVRGHVSLDGGIVYVNGMELAGLIRAFAPPNTGRCVDDLRYDDLTITIRDGRERDEF